MQEITEFGGILAGILAFLVIVAAVGVTWRMIWSVCDRRERRPSIPTNTEPWPSHLRSRLAAAVGVRGIGMNFRGLAPWEGGDPNRNQGHQLEPVVPQYVPARGDDLNRNLGHQLDSLVPQYVPARAEWPQKPQAVMTRGQPEGNEAQAANPPVSAEGEGSCVKAVIQQGTAAKEVHLHIPETESPLRKAQTEPSER